MKNKFSQSKVNNDLKAALTKIIEDQGGWEQFVNKGDTVFLKPNFNTSDTYPGSTDPAFLKEVIEQILPLGPKKIIVGDSSTMMASTEKVFKTVGLYDLETIYDKVKVLNLDQENWKKKDIPEARYLNCVSVPEILDKVDKLILLPCLKTHMLARFTGALKLSVGFMEPKERLSLHARRLQEKTAELNAVIKPDLVIMDGRTCFIKHGPMDGPREHPDLILASTDRTALDIEGVKIIQQYSGNSLSDIQPEELPQIKRAREMKIE